MRPFHKRIALAAMTALGALALGHFAFADNDLGQHLQGQIEAKSQQVFGISNSLPASSTTNIDVATANADPTKLVTLAKPLKAKVLASVTGAPNLDQISFWPNETNPEWLIVCNEQGTAQIGLVRIKIADGTSETIVASGLTSCDPTRRTPWGTILFGEENGVNGRMFEMIDPIHTSNVAIDAAGNVSGGSNPQNIIFRPSLGKLSFEGFAVYPSGVIYYADEKRPGDTGIVAGGSYFKYIPATPAPAGPIASLSQSPLVAGQIYGLRVGVRLGSSPAFLPDAGQGTSTGLGTWVAISGAAPINLRAAAPAANLTGYYRPEDFDIDLAAMAAGQVRFCANNTGNEGNSPLTNGHTYGETICITDGTLAQAATSSSVPEVQYLVLGNPQFSMMDNIAYQPGRGNLIIHEDGEELTGHNDLWDCAPDGDDFDLLSDGCIRIATLNDGGVNGGGSEWTGGIFSADGKHFYVSVQHNMTGKGTILDITGW